MIEKFRIFDNAVTSCGYLVVGFINKIKNEVKNIVRLAILAALTQLVSDRNAMLSDRSQKRLVLWPKLRVTTHDST